MVPRGRLQAAPSTALPTFSPRARGPPPPPLQSSSPIRSPRSRQPRSRRRSAAAPQTARRRPWQRWVWVWHPRCGVSAGCPGGAAQPASDPQRGALYVRLCSTRHVPHPPVRAAMQISCIAPALPHQCCAVTPCIALQVEEVRLQAVLDIEQEIKSRREHERRMGECCTHEVLRRCSASSPCLPLPSACLIGISHSAPAFSSLSLPLTGAESGDSDSDDEMGRGHQRVSCAQQ